MRNTKEFLSNINGRLNISEKVADFVECAENEAKKNFEYIDAIREYNQTKVLDAFAKNKVSEAHFAGSTGYGYGDSGRDVLEAVFADVFECEDALVRQQIISGTQALSNCFFAVLRPGDRLLAVTGKPYDTLQNIIGNRKDGTGSLADFGIEYSQVELLEDGRPDLSGIKAALTTDVKLALIQRSRGYSGRPALSVEEIAAITDCIKSVRKDIVVMVDNCYGEFTDICEPTSVGADLVAGSLIKNPGGGIAPTGGYICGQKDLVELCAYRTTVIGQGKEVGPSLNTNRLLFQGLYFAPHTVAESLKGNVLAARVFELLGASAAPASDEIRRDIVQTVCLSGEAAMKCFCKGVQRASAVDSFVSPEPWDMPGYDSKVIMAAGGFIQGSSSELSADGPVRDPYRVYMQGGLIYDQIKLALKYIITDLTDGGYYVIR